jgi:hypothetical protein
MSRPLAPVTTGTHGALSTALLELNKARVAMREAAAALDRAGSPRAAARARDVLGRVRAAIASAQGAERHYWSRAHRGTYLPPSNAE